MPHLHPADLPLPRERARAPYGPAEIAGFLALAAAQPAPARRDEAVILSRAQDDDRVLITGDHDFVQMLFASGGTSPSLILVRDVHSLRAADLAALLPDGLASGLAELLPDGVIASMSPDRVRVRPLPLRPGPAT